MGKGKLAKFADLTANPLVVEHSFRLSLTQQGELAVPGTQASAGFPLKGKWAESFFHNSQPIVLELGCGRGEYTVGLARQNPQTNYIGVDIKGARMWTGAQEALQSDLRNVGFLRTNIEFIHHFFAPSEVSEIWLTFSDPQMKKATKRLTSTHFLARYQQFLAPDGLIHLKTDSNFLFTYTRELLQANSITPEALTDNLYAQQADNTAHARSIQTHYETMWLEQGIPIRYLRFRLPSHTPLQEPDTEVPFDDYRSYKRAKRTPRQAGK